MSFFKRSHSEPASEAPKHEGYQTMSRRNAQSRKSHYGPHFEKGPQQEEIFDRRAAGERFPKGHSELRDRAHTFHQPRQQHEYSDPYRKVPQPWTNQMTAEHRYYHALSDSKVPKTSKEVAQKAQRLRFGPKNPPTNQQGKDIEKALGSAQQGRVLANRAVQAREGFAQKYPQAYEDHKAIKTHADEIQNRRKLATTLGKSVKNLEGKRTEWATEMRRHGAAFETD